jgi:glycosyltransferase involved in cell wall biosynthesis
MFPRFADFAAQPKSEFLAANYEGARSRKFSALDRYRIESLPGDRDEAIDLLIIGPFGAGSGLGTGVRRSVSALEHAGCNFRVLECMYDNPSAPLENIPKHLQFRGEQPRATLWHYNAEYLPEVMLTLPQFVNPELNIGYFFWETEAMPAAHRLGANMVDEIWTPSEFVRRCYDRCGVAVVNVGTSVDLPNYDYFLPRSYFGLNSEFTFMFSFDSHSVIHRKNPSAVIRAFKKAFADEHNVRLIIKTQNLDTAHWGAINGRAEEMAELCAYDNRIVLINRTMSLHELYSLKNAIDCYISLHRSEGFGYGPAEAMALGKPTIMTGYSANVEFGDKDASLLVEGPLIYVLDGEYLYWTPEMVWADPDVSVAAMYMRQVFDNRGFAADLGARGQQRILREFSRESMSSKYKRRLSELKVL